MLSRSFCILVALAACIGVDGYRKKYTVDYHLEAKLDASQSVVSPSGANHTGAAQDMMKYAKWIFKKAKHAYNIYAEWSGVKLALSEAKSAGKEASEAVEELAEKLKNAVALFESSGFKEFMTQVNNGSMSADMIKELFNRTTGKGEFQFYKALDDFRSMTNELNEIDDVADAILSLLDETRNLSVAVSEFSGALVDVDMSIFDGLRDKVTQGKGILNGLISKIKEQFELVKEMMDKFLKGVWDDAQDFKEALRKKCNEVFGDLEDEAQGLNTVLNDVVKPLVTQLSKGIRTLVEFAEKYRLPVDAPDHAADEEMGKGCSWRKTRWFKSIDEVDTEKTMSCTKGIFGRYRCRCIGKNDCYAVKKNRPDPSNIKRCFKKVKGRSWFR